MWKYDKKLQYPINIKKSDPKLANLIVTQYGGANGELAASLRYLNQRYTMPDEKGKALLTDIGTEELLQFRCQSKTRKITFNEKFSFKYLPPLSFV